MNDKGYIKLGKSFFSIKMWEAARTLSECEAWSDLIQSARFDATRPAKVSIGGREVKYARGNFRHRYDFLGTPDDTDTRAGIGRLRAQITRLTAHTMPYLQPTHNPKKKKEEERIRYYSNSNELLCGAVLPHAAEINYENIVEYFNRQTKGVFGYVRLALSKKRKSHIRTPDARTRQISF